MTCFLAFLLRNLPEKKDMTRHAQIVPKKRHEATSCTALAFALCHPVVQDAVTLARLGFEGLFCSCDMIDLSPATFRGFGIPLSVVTRRTSPEFDNVSCEPVYELGRSLLGMCVH
jgi:hypothetical protein